MGRSASGARGADAHAWNMFWDLTARGEASQFKLIDLTNVGMGPSNTCAFI